jgi:hypothetical protein
MEPRSERACNKKSRWGGFSSGEIRASSTSTHLKHLCLLPFQLKIIVVHRHHDNAEIPERLFAAEWMAARQISSRDATSASKWTGNNC